MFKTRKQKMKEMIDDISYNLTAGGLLKNEKRDAYLEEYIQKITSMDNEAFNRVYEAWKKSSAPH